MTDNQLLLFQMICVVAAAWALSAVQVRRARHARQALSVAALTTLIPVLGLSMAAFVFYGFGAWPYWLIDACAMTLAMVAWRRLGKSAGQEAETRENR